MIIIGDVHGKVDQYNDIISKTDKKTIQLGDFGFRKHHKWHLDNVDSEKHKILFGNHDDYGFLHEKHSLGDCVIGSYITAIRGAYSIDKYKRTIGVDWWPNEEIEYFEFSKIVQRVLDKKPKIIISHDCPITVRKQVFGVEDKSITSNALDFIFKEHKPKLWVFGHHHKSVDENINGVRFVCLNELETFDIEKEI